MKNTIRSKPVGRRASCQAKASTPRFCGAPSVRGSVLLVSKDPRLGPNLRLALARRGLALLETRGLDDALRLVAALRPSAILLDLDLPGEAAWEIADRLLGEATCPPMLLLSERTDQYDTGTAIRAGSLFDKSADPVELIENLERVLAQPSSGQAERNAIQRVLVRWLKPCGWSVPVTPAHRFWELR